MRKIISDHPALFALLLLAREGTEGKPRKH
jgi:hypothetical protein